MSFFGGRIKTFLLNTGKKLLGHYSDFLSALARPPLETTSSIQASSVSL